MSAARALQDKTLAYLADHHVMTLATHGPEGLWAAAVFYAEDDFDLLFLSAATTRHARNLAANPAAAATIQRDYRDWPEIKGVQLEGTVERLEGAERAAAIARYGRKFPLVAGAAKAPAMIARALARVAWYRLRPTRLYLIDNSLGFGHRDEVPLP